MHLAAEVTGLRRMRIGPYHVDDAWEIDCLVAALKSQAQQMEQEIENASDVPLSSQLWKES